MNNLQHESVDYSKNVLKVACQTLQHEIEVIKRLNKSTDIPINLKVDLGIVSNGLEVKLREIDRTIEDILAEINDPEALAENWQKYTFIKAHLVPGLATDLLAIIGGFYLQEFKLDNIRHDDHQIPMTEQARALLQDLLPPNSSVNQVLIVGEERIGIHGSKILRLRFPGFDIWNLPFIAHEYGYWAAYNDRVSTKFDRLISRIHNTIDEYSLSVDQINESGFIDEIKDNFHKYQRLDEKERNDFIEKNKKRIKQLKERQENYLCRLFADAFASISIGPAYVYALLHLRFVSDESLFTASSRLPAFTHRFVFAMQGLKWLQQHPNVPESNIFQQQIDELEILWSKLWDIAMPNQENPYTTIELCYKDWFGDIKNTFIVHYKSSMMNVHKAWRQIIGEDGLAARIDVRKDDKDKLRIFTEASTIRLAVINAAWLRRQNNSLSEDELLKIERNAVMILENPDDFLDKSSNVQGLQQGLGNRGKPPRDQRLQQDQSPISESKSTRLEDDFLRRLHNLAENIRAAGAFKSNSNMLAYFNYAFDTRNCNEGDKIEVLLRDFVDFEGQQKYHGMYLEICEICSRIQQNEGGDNE
jgi:hypothetical protein